MTPILLVAQDQRKAKTFLKQFCKTHSIEPTYFFEIEPLNKEISIDQVRDIKKQVAYSFSQTRLFALYQFDSASYQAQNALLKTLEEHDTNIQFVLVVTALHNVLPTIRSRCLTVDLKKDPASEIDLKVKSSLEKLIEQKSATFISLPEFQVKTASDAVKLFDEITLFFRNRLEKDALVTSALRQILSNRSLVIHHNITPQYAIDHTLIFIHKLYNRN